jgi:sortase A
MATWRPVTPTTDDGTGPRPPHASRPRRHQRLRWLERLLLVVGLASLGYAGYVVAEAHLYQAYEARELEAILASGPAAPPPEAATTAAAPRRSPPAPGATVGRLEIPRLGISAVVRAGSDARTLRLAVGHIPGTALPGDGGNIGLAAHRDTFFRRLGEIRPDDQIRFVTPDGTFTYAVEGTRVVEPSEVWVLDATARPALTLVTCYPFRFIGSAPQRFIVRAALTAG